MSDQYYRFLRNILIIGGMCISATVMLHAQDTNTIVPTKTLQKAAKRISDTSIIKSIKNTNSKNTEEGSQDTALHRYTDSAVITSAPPGSNPPKIKRTMAATTPVTPPLALPSFTDKTFSHYNPFVNYLLAHNALFNNTDHPLPDIATLRDTGILPYSSGPDLFYIITGILFFLAILRLVFTKYCSDLFRAFFNPALSQRQLRDQLSQTPFPAFLLNIFFSLSAGLYLFLILRHFNFITTSRPLLLIPAFMLLILIIYLFKYVFLRFSGWLFGYREAASGYVFTLYLVNKVMGIILLPFIVVLAFSTPAIAGIALNISLIIVLSLFIYRYIRIYRLVKNQVFLNKFHFFIYLCGFEIAPVLIIGKVVLIWLNGA